MVGIDHLGFEVGEVVVRGLGVVSHLLVWRLDGGGVIGWDELQAVKNVALGESVLCVEIFPPVGEVVDEVDVRHLWSIPNGFPLPSLFVV